MCILYLIDPYLFGICREQINLCMPEILSIQDQEILFREFPRI